MTGPSVDVRFSLNSGHGERVGQMSALGQERTLPPLRAACRFVRSLPSSDWMPQFLFAFDEFHEFWTKHRSEGRANLFDAFRQFN
jgi:hypothetical protein